MDTEVSESGLLFGFDLLPQHADRAESLGSLAEGATRDGPIWIHLDRRAQGLGDDLHTLFKLPAPAIRSLFEEDTRPHADLFDNGMVIVLRGVNFNPGSDPDDMIAMRMWLTPTALISLRSRHLRTARLVADEIEAGKVPATTGQLFNRIAAGLIGQLENIFDAMEMETDKLEDEAMRKGDSSVRSALWDLRMRILTFRRHLAPQRMVLDKLTMGEWPALTKDDQTHLRETMHLLARRIDDLDALRERTQFLHEELSARMGERMNERMYVLTFVTAICLPLGLLTGLLGINVGGMPGADNDTAFWAVCGIMVVLVIAQFVYFRIKRWL